jgi:hypothetical protein
VDGQKAQARRKIYYQSLNVHCFTSPKNTMNEKQATRKAEKFCNNLQDKAQGFLLTIDCYGVIEKHDLSEMLERGFRYFLNDNGS